jgi:predicted aspartyl protease
VKIRIPALNNVDSGELTLRIQIGEREYEFLVDSGATLSVVKPEMARGRIEPVDYTVKGITGENLEVVGCKQIKFRLGRSQYGHRFIVAPVSTPCDGILGADLLKALGAVIDLRTNLFRVGEEKFTLAGAGPCVASCAIHGEPEEVRGPTVGHPNVQVTRSEGGTPVLGHQTDNEPTPSHEEGRSAEQDRQSLRQTRDMPTVLSASVLVPPKQ